MRQYLWAYRTLRGVARQEPMAESAQGVRQRQRVRQQGGWLAPLRFQHGAGCPDEGRAPRDQL
ncbi:MAG TPA: hypothetical protein VNN80_21220, partial [Polyangiaceae bacterium]|nr:hypothetical protein [Polyangiaceae bacterium]